MKAEVLQLPANRHPWKGWVTIRLENGILCGIRNDYIEIPHDDLYVGMMVEVLFKYNCNIKKINFLKE